MIIWGSRNFVKPVRKGECVEQLRLLESIKKPDGPSCAHPTEKLHYEACIIESKGWTHPLQIRSLP